MKALEMPPLHEEMPPFLLEKAPLCAIMPPFQLLSPKGKVSFHLEDRYFSPKANSNRLPQQGVHYYG